MARRFNIDNDNKCYNNKNMNAISIDTHNANIYIHLPFCRGKCDYCYVNTLIYEENLATSYINAIINEIYDFSCRNPIKSIYFGGGTPSVIPIIYLKKILDAIKDHCQLTENCVITIEANPEDCTEENLVDWLKIGFNRLACGIQSFSDNVLKRINRKCTSKEILLSLENINKSFFKDVTIDILWGVPPIGDDTIIDDLNIVFRNNKRITQIELYLFDVYEPGCVAYNKFTTLRPKMNNLLKTYNSAKYFLKKNNFIDFRLNAFREIGDDKTVTYHVVSPGVGFSASGSVYGFGWNSMTSFENEMHEANQSFEEYLSSPSFRTITHYSYDDIAWYIFIVNLLFKIPVNNNNIFLQASSKQRDIIALWLDSLIKMNCLEKNNGGYVFNDKGNIYFTSLLNMTGDSPLKNILDFPQIYQNEGFFDNFCTKL